MFLWMSERKIFWIMTGLRFLCTAFFALCFIFHHGLSYLCGPTGCVCSYVDGGDGISANCTSAKYLANVPWTEFTSVEQDIMRAIVMTGTLYCADHSTTLFTNGAVVICGAESNKHVSHYGRHNYRQGGSTDNDDVQNRKLNELIGLAGAILAVLTGLAGGGGLCYMCKKKGRHSGIEETSGDSDNVENGVHGLCTRLFHHLTARWTGHYDGNNDTDEQGSPPADAPSTSSPNVIPATPPGRPADTLDNNKARPSVVYSSGRRTAGTPR